MTPLSRNHLYDKIRQILQDSVKLGTFFGQPIQIYLYQNIDKIIT